MELTDVYVAIEFENRILATDKFVHEYLCGYEELTDYYEYPQYRGENEFETENFKEMLNFVLAEEGRSYHFYFKNRNDNEAPIRMIFINDDGSLYLGVGVYEEFEEKYAKKLELDFKSSLILMYVIDLPPDNIAEFKAKVQNNLHL